MRFADAIEPFVDNASDRGERAAICTTRDVTSWSSLADSYREWQTALRSLRGERIGFAPTSDANSIAALAALQQQDCNAFLLDESWSKERQIEVAKQLDLSAIAWPSGAITELQAGANSQNSGEQGQSSETNSPGSITILTSGTTGHPKAVQHTWDSLSRPVRIRSDAAPPVWLLAFRPHLYAGLQVILQAILNGGTLVMAPPSEPPLRCAQLLVNAAVEYGSATPSYWRRLLMLVPEEVLRQIPLRQITIGGEAVDQPLLDRLATIYPQARVIHIYATTEMGRCFSVQDKQAGFPVSLLDAPTADGVELKIVDNQLWVRSSNAMSGYDDAGGAADDDRDSQGGWFATRDLVAIRDGRVYFVGRDSDMINVGGNKVHPGPIEHLIRTLPEIDDVQIYPVSSSVAGQLVGCKAVAAKSVSSEDARKRIMEICQQQLERFQCPRIVEIVDQLELTSAGKLKRS